MGFSPVWSHNTLLRLTLSYLLGQRPCYLAGSLEDREMKLAHDSRALGHSVLCSHSSASSRIQSVTTRDACSERCWPPSSDASVTSWAMCSSGEGVLAEWLWEIGATITDKQICLVRR